MDQIVSQSIFWILAFGALALYWQRRRRRRAD